MRQAFGKIAVAAGISITGVVWTVNEIARRGVMGYDLAIPAAALAERAWFFTGDSSWTNMTVLRAGEDAIFERLDAAREALDGVATNGWAVWISDGADDVSFAAHGGEDAADSFVGWSPDVSSGSYYREHNWVATMESGGMTMNPVNVRPPFVSLAAPHPWTTYNHIPTLAYWLGDGSQYQTDIQYPLGPAWRPMPVPETLPRLTYLQGASASPSNTLVKAVGVAGDGGWRQSDGRAWRTNAVYRMGAFAATLNRILADYGSSDTGTLYTAYGSASVSGTDPIAAARADAVANNIVAQEVTLGSHLNSGNIAPHNCFLSVLAWRKQGWRVTKMGNGHELENELLEYGKCAWMGAFEAWVVEAGYADVDAFMQTNYPGYVVGSWAYTGTGDGEELIVAGGYDEGAATYGAQWLNFPQVSTAPARFAGRGVPVEDMPAEAWTLTAKSSDHMVQEQDVEELLPAELTDVATNEYGWVHYRARTATGRGEERPLREWCDPAMFGANMGSLAGVGPADSFGFCPVEYPAGEEFRDFLYLPGLDWYAYTAVTADGGSFSVGQEAAPVMPTHDPGWAEYVEAQRFWPQEPGISWVDSYGVTNIVSALRNIGGFSLWVTENVTDEGALRRVNIEGDPPSEGEQSWITCDCGGGRRVEITEEGRHDVWFYQTGLRNRWMSVISPGFEYLGEDDGYGVSR